MLAQRLGLLLCALLAGSALAQGSEQAARDLFRELSPAVVQVRLIDKASGDKSSIGSGFQIRDDGLLVSNYHVVAEYVQAPERFRIEYYDSSGGRGVLTLLDIDVVNDLALLWTPEPLPRTLALGSSQIEQGERVFSLGNPFDLALSIIEGTFNGYVQTSRYRRILFSASLNPGMSGGPALAADGRVIGINVAHGAEQISFLVPVEALDALRSRAPEGSEPVDFGARITETLLAEQADFYAALTAGEWQVQRFGDFLLPWRIGDALNCWGGSNAEQGARYRHVYQQCENEDSIYIEDRFETGHLRYGYEWLESRGLSQMQFYALVEEQFRHGREVAASGEQVGPFRCQQSFLELADQAWRLSWCVRAYRRYRGLQDLSMILASADLEDRALLVSLAASGITADSARRFLDRFLGTIQWQP
jgi:hypothetical protein